MSHRPIREPDDELNDGDREWLEDFQQRAEDDERAAQSARTRRTWRHAEDTYGSA